MLKKLKKSECMILNETVAELHGFPKKEGFLFGVELELEGRGVALEGIRPVNWKRMEEGSLRGENCEYVFAQPCELGESVKRVNAIFKQFAKHEVQLVPSYRTSTHVHLNFSDKTVKQVINFFFLHTVLEELLEHYCGDTRRSNLFCMSCRDNEQLIELMESALFKRGHFNGFGNDIRYNAANLAALMKFGSIEIRTMRGADTAEQVIDWLDILNQLYVFSCSDECPPPWKLCENLSHLGSHQFLRQCFNDETVAKLMATWPVTMDLTRSLMNGVRLIQMLSYRLQEPWEAPAPEKLNPMAEMQKWEVPIQAMEPMQGYINNERAARLAPAQPHGGYDRLQLPSGQLWWVVPVYRHQPGDKLDAGEYQATFYADAAVYVDDRTGMALKWLRFNGEDLMPGSRLDHTINRRYYDEMEENEVPEPEMDEDDYEEHDPDEQED